MFNPKRFWDYTNTHVDEYGEEYQLHPSSHFASRVTITWPAKNPGVISVHPAVAKRLAEQANAEAAGPPTSMEEAYSTNYGDTEYQDLSSSYNDGLQYGD